MSHGNPIGTGRAVVIPSTPNAHPIGIRVHEAAIHHDAISLLSEYQARDFGVVINSMARRHLPTDSNDKAQYIAPTDGIRIPFQI